MKDKVLQELKQNLHDYVSGEALSDMLGVSRTAIWKYINNLKHEGYEIESFPRKGYKLSSIPDILNAFEISYNIKTKNIGRDIQYFGVIDSTNSYAKKIAAEGCEEGTVVVADCQTLGRGRLGRAWSSAPNKGIWMSVILRPTIMPEDIQLITLGASVAVVTAIEVVTGIKTGIKWPNDIILDGKKLCGILCEMNSEIGHLNFVVLGIGINVNHESEDFDEEIKDKAISLKAYSGGNNIRSEIIKEILFQLEQVYNKINNGNTQDIINDWKKYSVTLGREVRAIIRNTEYVGTALDIADNGRLVVQCADGQAVQVLSGEISLRGLAGYI